MIRRNFLFGAYAAAFLAPDGTSIAGGASPAAAAPVAGPGQVVGTDNAKLESDPDRGTGAGSELAAAAKLPDPPAANSTFTDPKKATVTHNPFAKGAATTVKLAELKVTKLAIYEPDGKHIAGDTVWTNEARADELISTGYAEHTGKTEDVKLADVKGFTGEKNTPPRV